MPLLWLYILAALSALAVLAIVVFFYRQRRVAAAPFSPGECAGRGRKEGADDRRRNGASWRWWQLGEQEGLEGEWVGMKVYWQQGTFEVWLY